MTVILKVIGIWLLFEALMSWIWDSKELNEGKRNTNPAHLVNAVRFVRCLIGTYLLTL